MIISVIFACDASYCFSKKLMFPTECPKEGKEKRRNIRKPQKIHGKKKKRRESFTCCQCIPENQIVG